MIPSNHFNLPEEFDPSTAAQGEDEMREIGNIIFAKIYLLSKDKDEIRRAARDIKRFIQAELTKREKEWYYKGYRDGRTSVEAEQVQDAS